VEDMKEIASLIHQNSFMSVPTNEANNVIISTWPYSSSDLQMELEASSRLVSVWEGMYMKRAIPRIVMIYLSS